MSNSERLAKSAREDIRAARNAIESEGSVMSGTGRPSSDPRLDKPTPARMYDYYLGGKDNFAIDREAAEEVLTAAPEVRILARENRAFLQRAVRFLAAEAGIRQFIDLGTGLPTQGNVHEVAHIVDPAARIVYVDNDPIVRAHAQALMESKNTTFIEADMRRPH
jgi:hypothetical protein